MEGGEDGGRMEGSEPGERGCSSIFISMEFNSLPIRIVYLALTYVSN